MFSTTKVMILLLTSLLFFLAIELTVMQRKDPTAFKQRFEAYKNGKSVKEIYDAGYIKEPVITPDPLYNEYINSLPDNQRLTPESLYRSHRYWELNDKPKNFGEAIGRGMFTYDFTDNGWHANSVALNKKTGEYEFMKPNWHSTKMYEDAWYYSKDGADFRSEYTKKPGVAYDKYVPRFKNGKMPYENGLPKYEDGIPAYQTFVEEMGPILYKEAVSLGVANPDVAYRNMLTLLAYESNYGTSSVARKLNNYGGVGWNGKTYTTYKNKEDFAKNYVRLMNSRYKNVIGADTLSDYAKGLKKLGYYEDTLENYSRNLTNMKSFARAMDNHFANNKSLYLHTPVQAPVIQRVEPAVSTAVRKTIPQSQTRARWTGAENISPYVTGKPIVKLNPIIKLPTSELIMDDAEWEPEYNLPGHKNGKLPGYDDGKNGYIRLNGNDIKFDEKTGELIDQVTGERGTMLLPEITITKANPKNYRSVYDANAAIDGFNTLTLGGLNNLDPTLWARRMYDLPKTLFGPMRFSTYMDRWINGNEGLVSSNFLQQHPWYSAGVNLLGGAALVGGSTQGPRIVHNIANRNQFFYKYLTPFSYDSPLKRGLNVAQKILTEPKINLPLDFTPSWMGKINNGIGKGSHGTYIGYIPEDIIAKAEFNGIENTPEYIDYALRLSRLENKFRDAAFRKYLNLPERDPLYIANQDGTFSYNLPYIEEQYAKNGLKIDTSNMNLGVDWITGNGGNLESTKNISFGHGIGSDSSKTFSMQEMTDTWDLHPFRRAENLLSKKYGDFVRKTADKIYTGLYYKLYDFNKPFKHLPSGYNWLGGKQLNKLRYSDEVPLQSTINKISKKLENFEVGPVMGGKPFVMKTNIPLTRRLRIDDNYPTPRYTTEYGLNADNILPQSYFDWLKYGDKKIASDFELGVPF